jgi:hypothetical protein
LQSFLVLACFLTLVSPLTAQAASLPGKLSSDDIRVINRTVLFPSQHRSWTAHSLAPEGALGFEVGLETAFVLRRELLDLGDGRGVVPRVIPVPRLWTSVELPIDIKLSGSVGLSGLFDGIQTYGLGVQWAFLQFPEKDTAFSVDFRYTHADLFGDAKSNLMGLAAQASKDLVVWQAYAGAGFVVANTTVNPAVLGSGVEEGPHTSATYHLFVGARVDLIAKLSIQLDVMAARPSVGVMLEKSF